MAAERKAKDEALAAERKAKDEALAAKDKAKDEALAAERKAKDEALAMERKANDDALALERKAKDEAKDKVHALEMERQSTMPKLERLRVRFVFGALSGHHFTARFSIDFTSFSSISVPNPSCETQNMLQTSCAL